MNHLLTSTGINIKENRRLEPNQGVFLKETNDLFVGNIYPFLFMWCGTFYSLDQCVDFSIMYAKGRINSQIDLITNPQPASNGIADEGK